MSGLGGDADLETVGHGVTSASVGHVIALPLDGISDAVVVLDRGWHYVYVNAKAGALFDRTPQSLVGRHIWTEFPDGVGQPFHLAYERVMASRVEERLEACYGPWDRWFENRIFPTADGILILFTETTDRRRAQEALERSERRFRALVEATAQAAWWTDASGAVVEPMPHWQAFTGQTAEESRGWGWLAALPPEDRERVATAWREAVAHGTNYLVEHRLRRHDGAMRTMIARGIPVFGPDGAVSAWVGANVDVTEEREVREALVASEARFRSLSASSPVGIFETDMAGNVTYVNRRATEIWGLTGDDALGATWYRHIHPDDVESVRESWRASLLAGANYEREYRLRFPDGTSRWVLGRSAPLRDARGTLLGAVGTIEDVTEHRELESRLRQVQKLEAVGQLAGGLAHDFNNLLTVIHGNLDFVSSDLPPDHAAQADLGEIKAATERTRSLVRQLLAFSRKQVLSVRRLDANGVVRDAERLLRRVLGEAIALRVRLAPEPLLLEADAGQLELVLLNLAINARDAMLTPAHGHPGRGGTLEIETDSVTLTAVDAADWESLASGRYVRLTLRDTGHGMDAETMGHAFEPFFTTKPVGEGTGLGLATTYGIVRQSSGAIRVTSTPGTGTTFVILLPQLDDPAPDEGTAPPAPRDAHGHGTVLLVEDERAVRATSRRLLERRGFTVLEAQHGADALLVWRKHRDAITAVVTDIRMPELGGRELVAKLHAEVPTLPVVYVSGYAEHEAMSELRPHETFVEKPFTGDVLFGALTRVLAATR